MVTIGRGPATLGSTVETNEFAATAIAPFVQRRDVRVFHDAAQTIVSGAVTVLAWNLETRDSDAFHDVAVNNSRLTVPAGMGGTYHVYLKVRWAASAAAERLIRIVDNAGVVRAQYTAGTGELDAVDAFEQELAVDVALAAGDWISADVFHNVGVDLNVLAGETLTFFGMHLVGQTP